MSRARVALGGVLLALAGCGGTSGADGSSTAILATTTSTRDSGVLDVLVPAFERDAGCSVKTVAVGSGQALKLGARGDADVLLVHSPAAEAEYMRGGHGTERSAVMHNDFVLVGPPSDPAGTAGLDVPAALRAIARTRTPFASRADESGTHAKELELWGRAGVRPRGSWYVETGQGMGETLQIASQKEAYTLSDRATFLTAANLDAKVLVEGDRLLRNDYHVIVVRQEGRVSRCGEAFARWITSVPAQQRIARYGLERYGRALFTPDASPPGGG